MTAATSDEACILRWISRSVGVVGLALMFLLGACGEGSDDKPVTLVGTVDGTEAFIGIQTVSGSTLVQVCDGAEIWSYLDGTIDGDELTATESGVRTLTAKLTAAGAEGSIVLGDGTTHKFTAELATDEAGLFAEVVRDGDTVTVGGWIRLADGSVRGKVFAASEAAVPTAAVVDDGGSVPPTADPVPARLGGCVRAAGRLVFCTRTVCPEDNNRPNCAATATCTAVNSFHNFVAKCFDSTT